MDVARHSALSAADNDDDDDDDDNDDDDDDDITIQGRARPGMLRS